jgi:hypothetical protein
MIAADVISLYTELENLRFTIWIDGGWGWTRSLVNRHALMETSI